MSAALCLITSLAMALSKRLGRVVTPDQLNDALVKHGAFDGAFLRSFEKAKEAVKDEFGVDLAIAPKDLEKPGSTLAATVDSELAAGRPVILYVDTDGDGEANHFVLAQRKEKGPDGKDEYVVIDPAYGREFRYQPDKEGNLAAKDEYYDWRRCDAAGKLVASGKGTPRVHSTYVLK